MQYCLDTFIIISYNQNIHISGDFMKKSITIILAGLFSFVCILSINSIGSDYDEISVSYSDKVNLVIDAGHGGIDAGAVGTDNSLEKDINLSIAQKLYDFAMVSGISSFLIRDGDYLYYDVGDDKSRSDLYNRYDFVNSVPNSTLISIHQNHFTDEKENGMQIWYSPNDSESKILADSILTISKDNLQKNNTRENKRSDDSYYLLYKAKVPSVMVECGFMSNTEENKQLQDNAYQNKLAYSIMLGFCQYLIEEN